MVADRINITAKFVGRAKTTAVLDSRYSFAPQFLRGAYVFARRARDLETSMAKQPSEEIVAEHLAYVTSAILQSTAALETEAWEVANHGPGYHLGSNGVDTISRDLFKPLADILHQITYQPRKSHTIWRLDLVRTDVRKTSESPSPAVSRAGLSNLR